MAKVDALGVTKTQRRELAATKTLLETVIERDTRTLDLPATYISIGGEEVVRRSPAETQELQELRKAAQLLLAYWNL